MRPPKNYIYVWGYWTAQVLTLNFSSQESANGRKYARGEACFQEHLFEHFNSEGHNGFLYDIFSYIDR